MSNASIRTSTFTHGESIPEKYTCEGEGEDRSPELTIADVPDDAAALAVVVDDPGEPPHVVEQRGHATGHPSLHRFCRGHRVPSQRSRTRTAPR